ncbi:MAG: DNA-directed RNA polymerase subunit N [Candidatus Thermoplasmatota archaeon]|jgi:DNA-directed RNA polymerase subunit N|nr:DNA-directed RNA polymerase subunit N [Candidatus Thermoplasmatota archaeon]
MIIPVRCFSCGKVVASDYVKFTSKMSEIRSSGREPTAEEVAKTLNDLHVDRYCCRRMILSHADLIDEILPFS